MYLCGIDLIGEGKPFTHNDGSQTANSIEFFRCNREKSFIHKLKNKYNIKIYNLNPKCDWIETIDIGINR